MSRFVDPFPQFFQNTTPIAAGELYFYEPGGTTLKDTFTSPSLTSANTNPVILDGNGRVPEIWTQGNYDVYLYTAGGIATGTLIDFVEGYEGSSASGQYGDWSNITTYGVGDFVKASNDMYYQSFQNNNLGNEPSVSATHWVEVTFISVYNANFSYSTGAQTLYDGLLYSSLVDSNVGNTPDSSPTEWQGFGGITTAAQVTYDNAASGLTAATAQAGIDELENEIDAVVSDVATNTADIATNAGDIATNAAAISTKLTASNNLSDLASAATARSNLSLGTLATQSGTFSGTSSGTNTGDQTNISGNAATVTTNANLTGPVTSVGNATTIAPGAVTLSGSQVTGTLPLTKGGTGQTSELAVTRRVTLNWTIQSDPGGTPSGTAGDVFAYY